MPDSPTNDSPQHVATVLVAGEHTVADHEGRRPGMVSQDPLRHVGPVAGPVGDPAEFADTGQEAIELVGLPD